MLGKHSHGARSESRLLLFPQPLLERLRLPDDSLRDSRDTPTEHTRNQLVLGLRDYNPRRSHVPGVAKS